MRTLLLRSARRLRARLQRPGSVAGILCLAILLAAGLFVSSGALLPNAGSALAAGIASADLAGAPLSLGTVTAYTSPSAKTAGVGEVFTVDVRANAGANQVDAATLRISYNTSYLEIVSVTPGPPLSTVIWAYATSGQVEYAAARLTNPPSAVTGDFRLFTMQVRALAPVGSTTLQFDTAIEDCFALAGVGQPHVLQNGTVTILAATETPTRTITPTPTNTGVYTPVPTPTATKEPGTGVQELILRQGVDGFEGFQDTYLSAWAPNESFCSDEHLRLRAPHNQSILLRYESWDTDGCDGAGSDRDAVPTQTRELFPVIDTYRFYPFDFDVTALVQQWIDDPQSNLGMVLSSDSAVAGWYEFPSSDYYDVNVRPRLLIRFLPGPTPTPTATATATATATPTTGVVYGTVFEDRNGDGVAQALEPGVPGAVVRLDGVSNPSFSETQTSGAGGEYRFEELEPGDYDLSVESAPEGLTWAESKPYSISVVAGQELEVPIPLVREGGVFLPLVYKQIN